MHCRYRRSHRGRRGCQNKRWTGSSFTVVGVVANVCESMYRDGCRSVCRHTNTNLNAIIHADPDLAWLNRSRKKVYFCDLSLPFSLRGRQLCLEFRLQHTRLLHPDQAPGSCWPCPPLISLICTRVMCHLTSGGLRDEGDNWLDGCSCVEMERRIPDWRDGGL